MRSQILSAGIFAISALANPLNVDRHGHGAPSCPPPTRCMTGAQASQVANNFKGLIADYSASSAQSVLAADFQDYSDSVSELINGGCPNGPATLGQPTFTSRAAFMAGQGAQPAIPFTILNQWQTCDTVAIRWRTTVASNATEFVTGIIILETEYNSTNTANPFQISTVYSEFNSGAWLVDLGVFVPNCSTASKRDSFSLPHRMA